jgi:hypothetical protein
MRLIGDMVMGVQTQRANVCSCSKSAVPGNAEIHTESEQSGGVEDNEGAYCGAVVLIVHFI